MPHKNIHTSLLNTFSSTLVFLVVFLSSIKGIAQKQFKCSTTAEIKIAMENVNPGDEIIIASGTYTPNEKYNIFRHITIASRFYAETDGTVDKPIIIRGEDPNNPPLLQGPTDVYDGYVFYVTADHWIIKDLKMKSGSKGLILDNANNVTIENVEVFDIASEAIHLRDGSSNTIIKNCYIHHVGIKNPGNGEGIYIGSDAKEHKDNFDPYCNNTTISDCTFGPNISAEAIDVKEEVDGVKIYNNEFDATGIVGDSRNDSFIDAKGINTYIYNNKFSVNNAGINAGVDIIQKKPKRDQELIIQTGYRTAIFDNTFNLGSEGASTPIARFKGGDPYDIHMWNNKRIPNTPEPISYFSDDITYSCPTWSIVPCGTLGTSNFDTDIALNIYPNPVRDILHIGTDQSIPIQEVSIINLHGQLLQTTKARNINVSTLATGVYILIAKTHTSNTSTIFTKN